MLTDSRFEEIKKVEEHASSTAINMLAIGDLTKMLIALRDCIGEIKRIRATPQVKGGRDHIKPVIFGADGKPVVPPPLSQQFAAERRQQFAEDRYAAVMSLEPTEWRVFALRWGLSPPPGGWGNHDAILNVLHRLRVEIGNPIPLLARHTSAVFLSSRGLALPPGVSLKDGVLIDERPDQQTSANDAGNAG